MWDHMREGLPRVEASGIAARVPPPDSPGYYLSLTPFVSSDVILSLSSL